MRGVGLFAHADSNHGIDGGIDIDFVTIFHVAYALHTFRCQQIDDLLDTVGNRFVFMMIF